MRPEKGNAVSYETLKSPSRNVTYLSNPSDVLVSILFAESQVLIQTKAHIVPIKTVGGQSKV